MINGMHSLRVISAFRVLRGESAARVAAELYVHPSTVARWLTEALETLPGYDPDQHLAELCVTGQGSIRAARRIFSRINQGASNG
jgi:hypothetical protein